jgi:hypothetical protein
MSLEGIGTNGIICNKTALGCELYWSQVNSLGIVASCVKPY